MQAINEIYTDHMDKPDDHSEWGAADRAFNVTTDINYPVFAVGDSLYINRDNKYMGRGWYFWQGDARYVMLKPHGDGLLCAHQINGDCVDVDYKDFKPDGQILYSGRAC